jgi:hypothetical protein
MRLARKIVQGRGASASTICQISPTAGFGVRRFISITPFQQDYRHIRCRHTIDATQLL